MITSASELMAQFDKKPGGIASFTEPGADHWFENFPWPSNGFYGRAPKARQGQKDIIGSFISNTWAPHRELYNKAVALYNSLPGGHNPHTYRPAWTDNDGDTNDDFDEWRGWVPAVNGLVRMKLEKADAVREDVINSAQYQHILNILVHYGHQILDKDAGADTNKFGVFISAFYQPPPITYVAPPVIMPPMFTCDQIRNWSSEQKKYVFTEAPFTDQGKSTRIFLSKEQLDAANSTTYTAQDGQVFPPPEYQDNQRAFVSNNDNNVNALEAIYCGADPIILIRKKDEAQWAKWLAWVSKQLNPYTDDDKHTGGFCGGWFAKPSIIQGIQSHLKLNSFNDAIQTLINLGFKTGANKLGLGPLTVWLSCSHSQPIQRAFASLQTSFKDWLNNKNVKHIDEKNYECTVCYKPDIAWLGTYKSVSFGSFIMENGWYWGTCEEGGPVGLGYDVPPSASKKCLVSNCPDEMISGITQVGKKTYIEYTYCYIPKSYGTNVATTTTTQNETTNSGYRDSIFQYWCCWGGCGPGTYTSSVNHGSSLAKTNGTVTTYTPFPEHPCCECDGFWETRGEDPESIAYWTAWLNLMYMCFPGAGYPQVQLEATAQGNYTGHDTQQSSITNNGGSSSDSWSRDAHAERNGKGTTLYYFDDLNHPTVFPPAIPDTGQDIQTYASSPGHSRVERSGQDIPAYIYTGDHKMVCTCSGTKNMIMSQIGYTGTASDQDADADDWDYKWRQEGEWSGGFLNCRDFGNNNSSSNSKDNMKNGTITIDTLSQEISPATYAAAVGAYLQNATQYVDAAAYFYNLFPTNQPIISQQINSILKSNSVTKNDDINAVLSTYGVGGLQPGKTYYNINDWNQGYTAIMSRHMVAFTANGSYALADQEYELKFIIILYTMTGSPGETSKGTKFQPPDKQYTGTYDSYTTNVAPNSIIEVKRTIAKGSGTFDGYVSMDPRADKFLWLCSVGGLGSLSQGEKDWVTSQGYGDYLTQGYFLTPVAKKNAQED